MVRSSSAGPQPLAYFADLAIQRMALNAVAYHSERAANLALTPDERAEAMRQMEAIRPYTDLSFLAGGHGNAA